MHLDDTIVVCTLAAMKDANLAKIALARQLRAIGIDRHMTSKLVNGKRRPSLATASRIEIATGIPAAMWQEAPPIEWYSEQIFKERN